jgi:hypothetical protein
MNIFHILQHCDELVLGRCACDDSCLSEHISATSRLQLHLVHEVLYTVPVENAVAVNEKHEQIIVSAEIVLVDSIDEAECLLLTASLAAMRKSGNSNSTTTVGDVDTPRKCFERDWHTKLLNGPQVQLVLVFAVEGKENVEAARRILAVSERVNCTQEYLGLFVVAGHNNDNFRCSVFIENVFDPARAANIVGDKLVNAEQPRHC